MYRLNLSGKLLFTTPNINLMKTYIDLYASSGEGIPSGTQSCDPVPNGITQSVYLDGVNDYLSGAGYDQTQDFSI